MQIFVFSETSIIVLMAFCELFHMEFSEFKNSIYFESYEQKTTEKCQNFSCAKIATIFEVLKILVSKFNTTILLSGTIIPENLSAVPSFHSEI